MSGGGRNPYTLIFFTLSFSLGFDSADEHTIF